ncbi:MAG: hypothetical protein LBT06_15700 [Hungatella sp.]|jgi:two-component SAPR family response regulator|nr:hypothetical protein [Hungatella sp.]
MKKQSVQLLNSKTRIPKECRYSLKRGNLLEKLFLTDAPVMIFHGKAGYGKTELARQYCMQCGAETLWYSMDSSDNDMWRFAAYFKRLFAGVLWQEEQTCFLQMLCAVSEELEREAGHQYLLVLEGLESIYNHKILDFIRKLIFSLPENLKLIFTIRGEIPDFMSRYVISGTSLVLEESELAFTETEQRALADRVLSHGAQDREGILDECATVLEGWPAGFLLALSCIEKQKLRSGLIHWPYLFQDSMINSFLSWEVFHSLSGEEKDFMVRTSGMEELKDSICDRVLQINNSGAMIRKLLRKNLLYSCVEQELVRIRCREALRLFLNGRAGRDVQEEIIRKSAQYYLEEGDYARAAGQAVKTGYTALIIKIMEVYGSEMLNSPEDQVLARCISYLEEDARIMGEKALSGENLPPGPEALGIAAQYYYKAGLFERMEKYLNQADSSFGKENKFGMYRALYKGLLKYRENPSKYEKQISNTLFLLEENRYRLPFLKKEELEILSRLEAEKKQETPGKLKVTFFGDFQVTVLKEQKPLSWRTRKGGELFAYLVELDGQAVGRNQLFKKLWSEDLPDHAVTMLHNMLYNIRKELSAYHMEDLIQYKDKLYCINMEKIETDLGEIRRLCALADQNNTEELKKHKHRFSVYWGRYLEDLDSQWLAEQREYYDTRFLKGCTILAEDAAAEGKFQEAVLFLKNAMVVNSYSEELAGSLLKCYGAMRNLKMVKTEYDRFVSLLERDLDMKPGRELVEIYKEALGA